MDKEEKPMEGVTITMYGASSSTKTDATRHFERHSAKILCKWETGFVISSTYNWILFGTIKYFV